MSQNELAQKLQMTQSFLSAIENGKSPLPIEKEEKLKEIFAEVNFSDYLFGKKTETEDARVNDLTDSDLFNQLLNRFHRQAHSSEEEHHHQDHHEKIQSLEHRLESMYLRNDNLMLRNDRLVEEGEKLRAENERLKKEIENLRREIFNLKLKSLG